VPAESSPRLLALHGLRLKGIAEPDVVAATVDAPVEPIRAALDELAGAGLVTYRFGRMSGYLLSAEGRSVGAQLLADELVATGTRPAIEAAYEQFLGINGALLEVCTAWQLRPTSGATEVNDHSDAAYDAGVTGRLHELHGAAAPVLERLAGTLARFGGHGRRLETAVQRVVAGDHDYFTKPMFPSYHSCWFELHEDLLATLGTDRAREGDDARTRGGTS
jgi:hypothetical protein